MLEFVVTAIIIFFIIILYIIYNHDRIAWVLLRNIFLAKNIKEKSKIYMGRFREHKKTNISKHIIVQLIPFISILAFAFVLANNYIFFGAVISGSMEPEFKKGDLVLMQTIDKVPEVGDIIIFNAIMNRDPITHRVSRIKGNIYYTKGDANSGEDNWKLTSKNIMGRAVMIGGKPIVIKDLGAIFVERAREFSIFNEMTGTTAISLSLQRLRAMYPLIITFLILLYFITIEETRSDVDKKSKKGRNKRMD